MRSCSNALVSLNIVFKLGMLGRFVVHGCQQFAALHGNLQVDATVRQIVFPQHGVFRRRRGNQDKIRSVDQYGFGNNFGREKLPQNIYAGIFSKMRFRSSHHRSLICTRECACFTIQEALGAAT